MTALGFPDFGQVLVTAVGLVLGGPLVFVLAGTVREVER